MKRAVVMSKLRVAKKKEKRERREENKRKAVEAGELGEELPASKKTRTIENTRIHDPTFVDAYDEEVLGDEAGDEFASIFANDVTPKIMITTRPRPSKRLFRFIGDLMQCFPNAFYYPRKSFDVKQICGFAHNKQFTHLMVLGEKAKTCNSLIVSRLGTGPTAHFKVSNVEISSDLPGHGRTTTHQPELILNRFDTRLGRRVGRFLGSLFPHAPQFEGRQVVTFHNQRDFIFVRHHRYVFDRDEDRLQKEEENRATRDRAKARKASSSSSSSSSSSISRSSSSRQEVAGQMGAIKTKLQELGPRFTLKLRWLQLGTFDTVHGEYEWIHKRKEMDAEKKKFSL